MSIIKQKLNKLSKTFGSLLLDGAKLCFGCGSSFGLGIHNIK
ncbi:hypothetical protein AGMMS49942_30050 [Spirochaetia bacterium]|nr:hypothetical protein AGMMS49942_30050 [Spirochaetia bacterium]